MTVLRTLSASSESAADTAANIITDLGTPRATLHVVAYQLSDVVRRGPVLHAWFNCVWFSVGIADDGVRRLIIPTVIAMISSS